MKKFSNWRLNFVLVFIILFGAAIISRLFFLQVLERKHFQAQALGQQMNFSNITGARGQIFSMSSQETKGRKGFGEIKSLAVNKENWTLSAVADNILDKDAFTREISGIVELSEEELIGLLDSGKTYVVIKKDLSSDDLAKIKVLNLAGVFWQNNPERFYPQGNFLSQTLGFLGGEGAGQYGLEGYYDNILQGKSGIKEENKGLKSIFAPNNRISLDGSDIYLTIDYNIQFQSEALLKNAKESLGIDSGQIIVMKPDSGRILALADFPSFDPNYYYTERNMEIFQNGAVQKLFEPGSVMKPLTMVSGLNEGKITPDTTYVDTGSVKFGIKTIKNFSNKIYGEKTMTEVLENSINTGAVYAQQQLGNKKFFEYLEKFGFTEKTGIDVQGEVFSRNEGLKNGPDMNFATASFGQGIDMTPIQLIRAFSAIANGGRIVKPYVVEKIVSGEDMVETKPKLSEQFIFQEAVSQITSMLVSVVENGLDKSAKIPGYYLAGKTGTAQIPLTNKRGYDENKTIQSFIGYGPTFNPQFLILVKLDNPRVPQSTLSAVPIFKELAQYILNYWKIPPDYDINE